MLSHTLKYQVCHFASMDEQRGVRGGSKNKQRTLPTILGFEKKLVFRICDGSKTSTVYTLCLKKGSLVKYELGG